MSKSGEKHKLPLSILGSHFKILLTLYSPGLTYHGMRFSSDQGNRTLLLVFVRGVCLGGPLIRVPFGSVEATVYNAGFLLKRLTHPISLIDVAQAWLPCQETYCMTFEKVFLYMSWKIITFFSPACWRESCNCRPVSCLPKCADHTHTPLKKDSFHGDSGKIHLYDKKYRKGWDWGEKEEGEKKQLQAGCRKFKKSLSKILKRSWGCKRSR